MSEVAWYGGGGGMYWLPWGGVYGSFWLNELPLFDTPYTELVIRVSPSPGFAGYFPASGEETCPARGGGTPAGGQCRGGSAVPGAGSRRNPSPAPPPAPTSPPSPPRDPPPRPPPNPPRRPPSPSTPP